MQLCFFSLPREEVPWQPLFVCWQNNSKGSWFDFNEIFWNVAVEWLIKFRWCSGCRYERSHWAMMVFLHDSWKIQLWLIKMNIRCILPPAGFSLFWHAWSSAFSPPSTSTSPCHRQRSSGWWVLHSPGISNSPSKSGINGAAYRCFCDFLMKFSPSLCVPLSFVQPLQYVPQSTHMLRMSNCSSVWVSGSVLCVPCNELSVF